MKELDYLEAIKLTEEKSFFSFYIFLGSSFYLKEKLIKALSDNFLGPNGELEIRDAGENELESLLESQENACLFAPRRLLYLKSFHELKTSSRKEFLKRIRACEDQILILELDEDPGDLPETVAEKGALVKEPVYGEKQLRSWALRFLSAKGKKITPEAMEYLLTHTNTTLENLQQELEKISLYAEEETITREIVEKVVSPSMEGTAFELVDAVIAGKRGRALSLLSQILQYGKEAPGRLIYLLFRQFRLFWQLAELGMMKRPDYYRLAQKLGDHPIAVKKALEHLDRFPKTRAQKALEELAAIDRKIKQGGEDPHLLLEKFIVEFSS